MLHIVTLCDIVTQKIGNFHVICQKYRGVVIREEFNKILYIVFYEKFLTFDTDAFLRKEVIICLISVKLV